MLPSPPHPRWGGGPRSGGGDLRDADVAQNPSVTARCAAPPPRLRQGGDRRPGLRQPGEPQPRPPKARPTRRPGEGVVAPQPLAALKQRASARRALARLNIPPQAAGQVGAAVLGAALDLGLVGDPGVFDAIDAFRGATAAEAELGRGRIADGPFAHVGAEGQHRGRARHVRYAGRRRGRRHGRSARLGRLVPPEGSSVVTVASGLPVSVALWLIAAAFLLGFLCGAKAGVWCVRRTAGRTRSVAAPERNDDLDELPVWLAGAPDDQPTYVPPRKRPCRS